MKPSQPSEFGQIFEGGNPTVREGAKGEKEKRRRGD
jgi:hypothetical protein